jgi:integrase
VKAAKFNNPYSVALIVFTSSSRATKAKIDEGPWNKNKAVGQMAPFTPKQAAVFRSLLRAERPIRDLALFNTAIDTMLRASDLLPLRVFDITDHNGDVVPESTIRQKKTGHGHVVALSPETEFHR